MQRKSGGRKEPKVKPWRLPCPSVCNLLRSIPGGETTHEIAEVAATKSTTPLRLVAAINGKASARLAATTTSSLSAATSHLRKNNSSSSVLRSNLALEITAVVLKRTTATAMVLCPSTTAKVGAEVVAVGVLGAIKGTLWSAQCGGLRSH